jgi:hypothetical protein
VVQHAEHRHGQRWSNFKVTVSTLRRPNHAADEYALKAALSEFPEYLRNNADAERRVFPSGPGHENDQIQIGTGVAEIGNDPRGGRVHNHLSIKTTHAGNYSAPEIQRNLAAEFLRFANEERHLNLANVYVHLELDRSTYWENYINKNELPPKGPRAKGASSEGYIKMLRKELAEAEARAKK